MVFGDVDPKSLNGNQMENLNEFVSRFGGAFVMIAGRQLSAVVCRYPRGRHVAGGIR